MNWFTGPISDAIIESQHKKLIFLVYTFDENSTEMTELWNDEKISNLCTANCVSIKLEANSDECNQFKQLYPITCFPTTYLIGNIGGAPIRIISGNLEKEEFIDRLKNAVEIHKTQINASVVSEASSSAAVPSSVPESIENDHKTKLDEKVALAKEKLRKIQEKKAADEAEKLRVQEIERRKLGQEVLKSKKDKEDLEMKRLAEAKRKEKLDDEIAKKRVMDRIQQDREDKKKKYSAEQAELDRVKNEERAKKELVKQQERDAEAANRSKYARIQFRLVDGQSCVSQFDADQVLQDARTFIANKLKELNHSTSFTMHSTFPKRDYTEQDMQLTLKELQLTPSASIMIISTRSLASKTFSNLIPAASSGSTASQSTSSTVVTYANDLLGFVLLPFTIIWSLVSGLLGIGGGATRTNSNQATPGASQSLPNGQSDGLRRRNIGGVHDRDRDDNATYNGNSTQQM